MGGSTFEGETDAGAFFFVDLRHRRRTLSTPQRPIPAELLTFTDRQRAICLLLSYGEPDKRIATLLDLGLRTVELDKQRAASKLSLATGALTVWSVENRQGLVATMKDVDPFPAAAAKIIQRACSDSAYAVLSSSATPGWRVAGSAASHPAAARGRQPSQARSKRH